MRMSSGTVVFWLLLCGFSFFAGSYLQQHALLTKLAVDNEAPMQFRGLKSVEEQTAEPTSVTTTTEPVVTRPLLDPAQSGVATYTTSTYQILSWYPRVVVYPNFVSPEQCKHIIALAESRMRPSDLAYRPSDQPDANQQIRTSTGTFLSHTQDPDGVLEWLEEKIAAATLLPRENGEAFNVLHYQQHQRYESHMDTFDPKEYGPQSSQRIATVLVYLSDVEEGGETVFPKEGKMGHQQVVSDYAACEGYRYKPRQGDALLFYSVSPDGSIDSRSLHGGCPVVRGEKWVATKWIRNKPMRPT